MRKVFYVIPFVLAILIGSSVAQVNSESADYSKDNMKPPVARKEPKITKIHGYELRDDYAWLRDRRREKNPEIIEYLEAENAYTKSVMEPYQGLADTIYDEIMSRIKQTDLSVPYKYGGYWYSTKTIEGKQYPVYLRSKTFDGKGTETLLDQNEMAEGHKFYSIRSLRVSDDGNLLAYLVDTVGYRQFKMHIKDLRTGEILPVEIDRVTSLIWASDNKTIFVTTENEVSKRSDKFWRYELETNKSELLYEEKDVLFNVYCRRSRDNKIV